MELELDPDFDPKSRRLCSDGACIGVIGPDGRCKVCGMADRGGPSEGGPVFGADDAEEHDDDEVAQAGSSDEEPGAGFDPNRKLCPDGSCIGVMGPDGRCTECGRGAEA